MPEPGLTDAQFWAILEAGGPYPLDRQNNHLDSVRAQLLELTPAQVLAFAGHFNRRLAAAYAWDLWAAAYTINGGCSDDGFEYFRCWLVGQGHAVYEATIADPDSLAGQTDPERDDYEFEELWYVQRDAHEELAGEELPAAGPDSPGEPAGERWDFDDDAEVRRRLPRLAAIYLT